MSKWNCGRTEALWADAAEQQINRHLCNDREILQEKMSVLWDVDNITYSGSPGLWSLKIWLNLQFSLFKSVFETFFILNAFHCRKHNYFCLDIWLGLLFSSIVVIWNWMFLKHHKWITTCFDGLNQSHSTLSCIISVFGDHKRKVYRLLHGMLKENYWWQWRADKNCKKLRRLWIIPKTSRLPLIRQI